MASSEKTARLFVAGRSGQVARALADRAGAQPLTVIALGRPDFDLLDPAQIEQALDEVQPVLVINAAAYTAVDLAESEPEAARALNADAAAALSSACAARGLPIVHLSTDYVFDGTKPGPYSETDTVAPLGVYGASKLAGEQAVAAANPDHLLLRTAWVYSPFGKNFVKTMLRLAAERDEVGVVADQQGNPTSALDIADALLTVSAQILDEGPGSWDRGTFHLAGTGDAVWADLAEHVFAISDTLGGPTAQVRRISTSDYPTPVTRPVNSRLDTSKLRDTFGVTLPHWEDSVRVCVERLLKNKD